MAKPILERLKLRGEVIIHNHTAGRNKIYVDAEGYFMEEGRDDFGCREVEVLG